MTSAQKATRLSAYAALAGAAIPAAASGAIVSQTGLNLVATPGSPVALDFGTGIGEIFVFSVAGFFFDRVVNFDTTSGGFFRSETHSSTQYQVVQFDPANAGGWISAGVVGNVGLNLNRLGSGGSIGPVNPNWLPMSALLGSDHRLASRYLYSYFTSYVYGYVTSDDLGNTYFTTTSSDSSGTFDSSTNYEWAPNKRGFLGLRFTSNGTDFLHAWVDVESDVFSRELIIHGWGLEKTPNVGIEAGEVPSPGAAGLALLAMGAAGVRRQRRAG
jgi:MYXO-CTERM domain-containing protein